MSYLRERLLHTQQELDAARDACMKQMAEIAELTRQLNPRRDLLNALPLYKILGPDGDSIHGGNWKWSLPEYGLPGEWQDTGEAPNLCYSGFHLTTMPHQWWFTKGCRLFLAEPDWAAGYKISEDFFSGSPEDVKVAVRRCRLLRELSPAECAALGVMSTAHDDGCVYTTYAPWCLLRGGKARVDEMSSTVNAYNNATVHTRACNNRAYSGSFVHALGFARVLALSGSVVYARNSSVVRAFGGSQVFASDEARVIVGGEDVRVFVAGDALAQVKTCLRETGCVIRSKKAPGVIVNARGDSSLPDINSDRWKVVKIASDTLAFKQR